MNKNIIPFNSWSKEKIKNGVKICTSRHRRYPKDKRVWWISPKLPWWFIKDYLYLEEGAESKLELQEVIEDIYKRKVLDDELFYVHFGKFQEGKK